MGCPIEGVCAKGAGSTLLTQLKTGKMEKIIDAASSSLRKIPLTIKIRMGYHDRKQQWNAHDIVNRCCSAPSSTSRDSLNAGWLGKVAAVTLHGRTRAQRYSRLADWAIALAQKQLRVLAVGKLSAGYWFCTYPFPQFPLGSMRAMKFLLLNLLISINIEQPVTQSTLVKSLIIFFLNFSLNSSFLCLSKKPAGIKTLSFEYWHPIISKLVFILGIHTIHNNFEMENYLNITYEAISSQGSREDSSLNGINLKSPLLMPLQINPSGCSLLNISTASSFRSDGIVTL